MNNEEFIKVYCKNTPLVSNELQVLLLAKARENDEKEALKTEADLLKQVLRQKGMINE